MQKLFDLCSSKILLFGAAHPIQKGQNEAAARGSSTLTAREGSEMPYDLYVYTCVKQVGILSPTPALTVKASRLSESIRIP